MDVGKRIRELRERYKISQCELARLANIGQSTLSDIERGIKQPTITTIENICRAFNISLSEFFSEEKPEFPPEIQDLLKQTSKLTPEQIKKLSDFLSSL